MRKQTPFLPTSFDSLSFFDYKNSIGVLPSDAMIVYDLSDVSSIFQDAAGTTPVTAAGQSVGLVLDRSGRSYHASTIIASNRATYQVDGSGRPYLYHDGIDDRLSTAPIAWGSDALTVVAAIRREGGGGAKQVIGFGNTASDAGSWGLLSQPGTGDPVVYAARRRGTTGSLNHDGIGLWPATDLAVISVVAELSPALSRIRRNGLLDSEITTTGGSGSFGTWPIDLGARPNETAFFKGRLYGLMAINRVLSDSELTQAEAWMAAKAGVTISY